MKLALTACNAECQRGIGCIVQDFEMFSYVQLVGTMLGQRWRRDATSRGLMICIIIDDSAPVKYY